MSRATRAGSASKEHTAPEAVISSEAGTGRRLLRSPKKKTVFFALLVLLVVVAAVVVFLVARPSKEQKDQPSVVGGVTLKNGQSISGQVNNLSSDDLNAIAKENVDPKADPDKAYARAIALSSENDNQAAVDIYKALIADNNAPYYVLSDYALTLSRMGDNNGAAKEMQAALTALKNDKTVSSDVKEAQSNMMNNKLVGFQQQAKATQ